MMAMINPGVSVLVVTDNNDNNSNNVLLSNGVLGTSCTLNTATNEVALYRLST